MQVLLLGFAAVLFGLSGFGLADDSEHFQFVPVGLLSLALALLYPLVAGLTSRRVP